MNSKKITFELKHGYYAIISLDNGNLIKHDLLGDSFDEALGFTDELVKTLSGELVHLGNYDVERKMNQ